MKISIYIFVYQTNKLNDGPYSNGTVSKLKFVLSSFDLSTEDWKNSYILLHCVLLLLE